MALLPENEKEVQMYLELYKQQMERFHQTQEIEWKVNIAFWTLLAGGIYLTKDHALRIWPCVAWALALLVIGLHLWWLVRIHKSEQRDKKLWVQYRAAALTLMRGHPPCDEDEKHGHRTLSEEVSWLVPEVGMTIILALLLAYRATLS